MSINTLRRYSRVEEKSAEPKELEGFIPYAVNGWETLTKARFFTTNEFPPDRYSPEAIGNCLAVTYYPRWHNLFAVTPDECNVVGLTSPYLGNQPTRIWPAFGKDGGACEVAMTKGLLRSTRNLEEFASGGGGELYWQDSVQAGEIAVRAGVDLAERLGDWFTYAKAGGAAEKPAVKVVPPNGATVAWTGQPSLRQYSISCAFEPTKAKYRTELSFWGDVWDDENANSESEGRARRSICSLEKPALCRSYPFPLEEMRKVPRNEPGGVYDALLNILDRLVVLARDFKKPRTIQLSPYVRLTR
jgi:hypothetical protein